MWPKYVLMEGEGNEGGGGGGGSAIDPKKIDGILQVMANLASQMGKFDTTVQAISSRLESLENRGGDGSGDDDRTRQESDDVDFDSMTNAQLAAHINSSMTKNITKLLEDKVIKPLSEQILAVGSKVGSVSANSDIEKLAGKHKDFNDWRPEIAAELKKNDRLSIEDAYILARTRNEAKAKELDDKYNPPSKFADLSKGFFGLGPSGVGDKDAKSGNMDRKSAAEAAWEETIGSLQIPST